MHSPVFFWFFLHERAVRERNYRIARPRGENLDVNLLRRGVVRR